MSHPLLGFKTPKKGSGSHVWQLDLNTPSVSYLKDHAFRELPVVPGSAYVEIGLAGIMTLLGNASYRLLDISFDQLLILSGESRIFPTLLITEESKKNWRASIVHEPPDVSHPQQFAHLNIELDHSGKDSVPALDIEPIRARCHDEFSGKAIYDRFKSNRNEYGSTFQSIANLYLGDHECLASLRLHSQVEAEMYQYHIHPAVLDTCIQALACIDINNTLTYVLSHIEELEIHQFPSKVGWIHAIITDKDTPGQQKGDIKLFDTSNELVLHIKGVTLVYLPEESTSATDSQARNKVVVSATFTAEPVEPSLNFWMDTFQTPSDIVFSPYNQVFQELLKPDSLLASNKEGTNVILLRFEDWAHYNTSLPQRVDEHKKARLLSQRAHFTLPNQVKIAHLNKYETEYLYKEIFEGQTYLKHGIDIPPDACVIDVGANIGMFTLFVLHKAPEAEIYAFEPSPAAFEALSINTSLYGKNVTPFNLGLSDADGEATFTFYSNSSVFSSFHADQELDKAAIQTVVENALIQTELDQNTVGVFTEELMENRLQKQTFPCKLKTLSTIIDEEEIKSIDLLKVDVEKSELYVLRGIREEHWLKIRQIVIEVHDTVGDVISEVTQILDSKGFEVVIEEEDLLKESGLYNLYGRRMVSSSHSRSEPNQTLTSLEQNIQDFSEGLAHLQQSSNAPCIIITCPPSPIADEKEARAFHTEAEDYLKGHVEAIPNTYLIKQQEVFDLYPVDDYYDVTGHAIGDIPYSSAFFSSIGTAIARRIQAISRKPYKVIVLDCDNTLWQGIVGEAGPTGIDITPSHAALQAFMINQLEAGMLLCLCSKNAEDDVLAVFEQNPQMILRREHIVAMRVNWNAKSENIIALSQELGLGLDSFIFVDDNPVECAEVQAHCPDVLTLQLPADTDHIEPFLHHVWAFDHLVITSEDRKRTLLYQQNIHRSAFQKESLTFASFIEGLKLHIQIEEAHPHQLPRIAQLTQRTNQFNTTTKRRSEPETRAWLEQPANQSLAVHVKDRFGDYGLVGTILYSIQNDAILVDSFILSCRVLGKGVEHAMLNKLGEIANVNKVQELRIPYGKTPKNLPVLRFLLQVTDSSKVEAEVSEYTFTLAADRAVSCSFNLKVVSRAKEDSDLQETKSGALKASMGPFQDIADRYRTAEEILKAVQQKAVRTRPRQVTTFIAPEKKLEQSVAIIWKEVLGIEEIGIQDNFFEIGGNSLRAVQVISKIRSQLGVDISLISMFERPNIKALASLLEGASGAEKTTSTSRQRGEKRRSNRVRRSRQRNS